MFLRSYYNFSVFRQQLQPGCGSHRQQEKQQRKLLLLQQPLDLNNTW